MLSSRVGVSLTSVVIAKQLSKMTEIPSAMCKSSSCSVSLPVLGVSVFNCSHSGGYVVVTHCGFYFFFSIIVYYKIVNIVPCAIR